MSPATPGNAQRWSIALGSAVCMAVGMSAIFMGSFPVFLGPVSQSLGWGKAIFPQITVISASVGALCNPISGRLIDRIGVKLPLSLGFVLFSCGLIGLSFIQRTGPLFWGAGIAIGFGAALSGPLAFVKIISSWFADHRALMLGLVLATAPMLSQAAIAPITHLLINDVGWRDAYRAIAAGVCVLGLGFSLTLLKLKPSAPLAVAPPPSGDALPPAAPHFPGLTAGQALRGATFWTLTAAACLGTGSLFGLTAHLMSWLTGRGVTADHATLYLSALALSGILGTFLSGYLVDRVKSQRIMIVFYLVPLAGTVLMIAGTSVLLLLLGVVMTGFGSSAITGLSPYFVTRYFGLKSSGEIFGISLAFSMLSIGCGPFLIGLGYDRFGGYAVPITLVVAALTAAALLVALLKPYPFSVDRTEATEDADLQPADAVETVGRPALMTAL